MPYTLNYIQLMKQEILTELCTQDEVEAISVDVLWGFDTAHRGGLTHGGGCDWPGEVGRPLVHYDESGAVEPECSSVENGSPGTVIMWTGLFHRLCSVK